MNREQLVAEINNISSIMKGPLPDIERMLLHKDRQDLRKKLADLDSKANEKE